MANSNSTLLTAERVRFLFLYDPETGIFTRRLKTGNGTFQGQEIGSWDLHGYKTTRINKQSFKLHRLAWLYVHGVWPDGDIDHINGSRNDNRIENLRCVSRQVNLQNRRSASSQNKSTGLLGVHLSKSRKKFSASISVDNKTHYIGVFDTPEEAQSAYIETKRRLHPGCMI